MCTYLKITAPAKAVGLPSSGSTTNAMPRTPWKPSTVASTMEENFVSKLPSTEGPTMIGTAEGVAAAVSVVTAAAAVAVEAETAEGVAAGTGVTAAGTETAVESRTGARTGPGAEVAPGPKIRKFELSGKRL